MKTKRCTQPQTAARNTGFRSEGVEPNARRTAPAFGDTPGASGDVEPPKTPQRRSFSGNPAEETGRRPPNAKPVGGGEAALMRAEALEAGVAAVFEPLLTAEYVATALNISLRQTRRLIADGALPVVRIGRVVRVRPADLHRFIQSNASR